MTKQNNSANNVVSIVGTIKKNKEVAAANKHANEVITAMDELSDLLDEADLVLSESQLAELEDLEINRFLDEELENPLPDDKKLDALLLSMKDIEDIKE